MKFRVTFKTPDVVSDAITEHIERTRPGLEDEEFDDEFNRLDDFVDRWVRHGEYVTIEFDLTANSATVLRAGA